LNARLRLKIDRAIDRNAAFQNSWSINICPVGSVNFVGSFPASDSGPRSFKIAAGQLSLHPVAQRLQYLLSWRVSRSLSLQNAEDILYFRGDRHADNDDNPHKSCLENSSWELCLVNCVLGRSPVILSGKAALLSAAIAACVVLQPLRAHAQWWSRAPADFEECADKAEKAAAKEERTSQLTECNAKFAGRRKPGGGYSYFDFMQNRNFDIAGPNPTPEEQKQIDEQYTAFLDRERRSNIAAAFTAKQQQQQLQQASLRNEKVPLPPEAPNRPAAANDLRSRAKTANCARHSFSCDWPRLSEGIKDLKKALFGPPQGKGKRS
jgi:hypothetical protein